MNTKTDVNECSDALRCFVPFNINKNVRVRLTNHGRKVHRQKHDDFWRSVNKADPPAYLPPDEDEEGWSKWQMWTLMQTFGDHIGMGHPNCFDLTIELETNEGT